VDGFHLRFVLENVVGLAVALLALAAVAFVPTIVALRSPTPAEAEAAAGRFLLLHAWLWPAFVVVLTFATVQLIITTHKVAGPLVRFRRVLGEVRDGRYSSVVTLRNGDYLGLEAHALNEALEGLRTRGDLACEASRQVVEAVREMARDTALQTDAQKRGAQHALQQAEALHALLSPTPHAVASAPPADAASVGRGLRPTNGFSLVEIVLVIALIVVLAAMAVPQYAAALDEARVARAIGDIKALEKELWLYALVHGQFPPTLADIGREALRDPWGNPYYYLVLAELSKAGNGGGPGHGGNGGGNSGGDDGGGGGGGGDRARKDRNLHPLNSDFDLYSAGADGETVPPITAKASQDDIIRASDGGFIGRASRY
jgi:general secretion pathway protein G